MSELQLSAKFQYQELLIDSDQTQLSQSSGYTSKNWPHLTFADRNLNPAALKVISAEVPVVFDTLLEGSNTFLVTAILLGLPVIAPIQITAGNYTVTELTDEIETQLNAVFPGWTITWNDMTQKFTFNHSAGDFTFDFSPIGGTLRTNLHKFLGFAKDSINTSSGNTLVSSNVANPSGPFYLYLNSRLVGQDIKTLVQNNGDNVAETQICRVPINAQRGGIIFYTDPTINNYFDMIQGYKFQDIDLYFTLESAYGYQVVDFKGLSFSVKIALLTYREGGSSIMAKPGNSRFAGT